MFAIFTAIQSYSVRRIQENRINYVSLPVESENIQWFITTHYYIYEEYLFYTCHNVLRSCRMYGTI